MGCSFKRQTGVTIVNVNDSTRQPNKKCVDKGSEFYNKLMKSWLEKMI